MDIVLRTRTKENVVTFWDKARDEEIKQLFPFSNNSLEEALILFEKSLKENATSYGKVIYFGGKYIGDIWCYGIDESNEKMAMLSVIIFEKELWGKGIATEAIKLFVKKVFSKFDVKKIGAITYSNNFRSIGLLEKAGFKKIETFIEDGVKSIYYEIPNSLI